MTNENKNTYEISKNLLSTLGNKEPTQENIDFLSSMFDQVIKKLEEKYKNPPKDKTEELIRKLVLHLLTGENFSPNFMND